jgi:type VI secretion system protein ImpL
VSKLMTLFRTGWFITLVGIVLLSVLIWLGGPYLGLGDSQPLASPIARLVLIVLIVVVWVVWLQVQALRARS